MLIIHNLSYLVNGSYEPLLGPNINSFDEEQKKKTTLVNQLYFENSIYLFIHFNIDLVVK